MRIAGCAKNFPLDCYPASEMMEGVDALEIISEIAGRTARYEQLHNGKPRKLLLGKSEWTALQHFADQVMNFKMLAADGLSRPEFKGMKVYPVDDENYIGVNA